MVGGRVTIPLEGRLRLTDEGRERDGKGKGRKWKWWKRERVGREWKGREGK